MEITNRKNRPRNSRLDGSNSKKNPTTNNSQRKMIEVEAKSKKERENRENIEEDEKDEKEGELVDLFPPKNVKIDEDNGYCLTMHNPYALLLVLGIKKVEGRSWISHNFQRGRLWIHSASKEPYRSKKLLY